MSKLILVLTLYIRCLSAQITTEQQLMDYCNGVTWTSATKAKWSPGTKTCVQYYNSWKNYADSETLCQTSKPEGTKARLLHVVDESFAGLATASVFKQSLKGWVGGKKYPGLDMDYTANYQTLGDFRWYEGAQCTSSFNASVISSGGFNNVQQTASGDCLLFTFSKYVAASCTSTAYRYCEYYLGPAGNLDCEQTITTDEALKDFCVEGGSDRMKWTSDTCVQYFTKTKTWEDAYTACRIAAPPGAKGRLVHATTPELQTLSTLLGLSTLGWVGGKRFSVGDPSWNPGPGIKDWKWLEGECKSNEFNATEMEPLFNPTSSYAEGSDCLEYYSGKFRSQSCTNTRNRVCQFYVGDGPNPDGPECGEKDLPGTDGLKKYCEEDPYNNLWESSGTCFRRYFDLKNKDDAAQACNQAAPPGTTGRLAIIPNILIAQALNSSFADLDRVWLGAVRAVEGGTDITNWTWTEEANGKTCKRPVDLALNAISNIISENTKNCLMLNLDFGTLNDKLCTEADIGRMCEFYYGEGPFTHGLCKPHLQPFTLYEEWEVGKCGTTEAIHTEYNVSKPSYCALLCWRITEKCESFNYDPDGEKCELFSRNDFENVGEGPTATCSFYKSGS